MSCSACKLYITWVKPSTPSDSIGSALVVDGSVVGSLAKAGARGSAPPQSALRLLWSELPLSKWCIYHFASALGKSMVPEVCWEMECCCGLSLRSSASALLDPQVQLLPPDFLCSSDSTNLISFYPLVIVVIIMVVLIPPFSFAVNIHVRLFCEFAFHVCLL